MYAPDEIVGCVECRVVFPKHQAYEGRDGYFCCGEQCYQDHVLRLRRRREGSISEPHVCIGNCKICQHCDGE